MDIYWLASYPKSGNTWVRFLFTHVLNGPFDYSQTIFEVTPVLERGIAPAMLSADRPNLIKTHNRLTPDLPFMENARGAIYIVRDPLDVMLSNMNYFLLSNGNVGTMSQEQINDLASQYVQNYLAHGGDPRWQQVNYGSWQEHVESWTENDLGLPVKVIRYEDLLSDTPSAVREAAAFVGIELTDEKLAEAVELSSFENMKAMEEREIREKRSGMFFTPERASANAKGFRFMNRGKRGTSREMLTPDVIENARAVFSPHVERMGYAG
jgi:hypothetical protein